MGTGPPVGYRCGRDANRRPASILQDRFRIAVSLDASFASNALRQRRKTNSPRFLNLGLRPLQILSTPTGLDQTPLGFLMLVDVGYLGFKNPRLLI